MSKRRESRSPRDDPAAVRRTAIGKEVAALGLATLAYLCGGALAGVFLAFAGALQLDVALALSGR